MFKKKEYIIVGLTTFHTEFLRISVPQLAKLRPDAPMFLIINNDNPMVKITKRQIRNFGYRGKLHIINSPVNQGPMCARLNILAYAAASGIKSEWMIFVDDDDLLIRLDIPNASIWHYAIMQNMIFIKQRLVDLLRLMDNPYDYKIDDARITSEKPHIGIVGTLLRTKLMCDLGAIIRNIVPEIHAIDATLTGRPPEDIVMWFYLQIYARHLNPNAAALYSDSVNYIATMLDSAPTKYGKPLIQKNVVQQDYDNVMAQYCQLFEKSLQYVI